MGTYDNPTRFKPVKRSKLRLFLGMRYYIFRRCLKWVFGGFKFARHKINDQLKFECFCHKTPLLRKLKDVEMYLQYNKIVNLKLAVKRLNHIVIKPGETFSYWRAIGNPTGRKGYLEGMVIKNGRSVPGVGGGLCQLSNLIYWMTLHTPLTVTERPRHCFDVFPDSNRTQPFASGATCSYNYLDLMIRNDTRQTFQLCLDVTDAELVGRWYSDSPVPYSYQIYEKDHRIDCESWGGYSRHNTLYRRVFDINGSLIADEFIVENHAIMMYQPYLEQAIK